MNVADIQLLLTYNTWANTHILDQAARVPADQFATAALGICNLRDTLEHVLVVESIWRLRVQGIDPATVAFPDAFPTLESIRAQWQIEDQALHAFIDRLSDDDLSRTISYRSNDGTPQRTTLWHILAQVVNHGTQHRSELALLLTALGYSPGNLDLIVFLREQHS